MAFPITPKLENVTIVLRGTFNPVIFSPAWFEKFDVLPIKSENVDVNLIHPELTAFEVDWLDLSVDKTSFTARAKESPWGRCLDLVGKTFGDYLEHTPITQLGINYTVVIPSTYEQNEKLGCLLAPRAPWGDFGAKITSGEGSKHGGLRNLTMEIRDLDDRESGYVGISISPDEGFSGLKVVVNDHFEFADVLQDTTIGASQAMATMNQQFEKSLARSEDIIVHIMGLMK